MRGPQWGEEEGRHQDEAHGSGEWWTGLPLRWGPRRWKDTGHWD